MDIQKLTAQYIVRNLDKDDLDVIYDLCKSNPLFYQYHPPFVTPESILEDMRALPPNKEYKDKHYIGFFENTTLIAVMDLIENYPQDGTAMIGFFAVHALFQGKEVGTRIISDCAAYLRQIGFQKIRLGIDSGNPQSKAFWTKNKFVMTGEEIPNDFSSYFIMERRIV